MGCPKLPYLEENERPIFLAVWKKSAGKENCENYYPFGLTFNSYSRENSLPNRWKFQGQEHIDDLGLNWDSFKWRNHQPDIGRFFNIDPLAAKYVYNSPYAFSENKVINGRELEGLEWVNSTGQQIYDPKANGGKGDYTEHATNNDRRLGNSLQGTSTGQGQFSKLVNADHPITTEVNMSDKVEVNPKTGGITTGDTKNTRDSYMDLATGKVDEVDVKKSEIKINVASMEKLMEKGGTFSGESVKGLTFDQLLGAVLGHEIEHTTDANNIIDANKQDAEKPAHDVSRQIIQETKKKKDEK
jgi:RHS repeat-associated protein